MDDNALQQRNQDIHMKLLDEAFSELLYNSRVDEADIDDIRKAYRCFALRVELNAKPFWGTDSGNPELIEKSYKQRMAMIDELITLDKNSHIESYKRFAEESRKHGSSMHTAYRWTVTKNGDEYVFERLEDREKRIEELKKSFQQKLKEIREMEKVDAFANMRLSKATLEELGRKAGIRMFD